MKIESSNSTPIRHLLAGLAFAAFICLQGCVAVSVPVKAAKVGVKTSTTAVKTSAKAVKKTGQAVIPNGKDKESDQ